MMICRVDTTPFSGLFDEFEVTWCIHPLFLLLQSKKRVDTPRDLKFVKKPQKWGCIHPTYQHLYSNSRWLLFLLSVTVFRLSVFDF